MNPKSSFVDFVLHDAFQDIRGVTARAMFGGHGLYKSGVIFGIIADDQLYFKVDGKTRPGYESRGSHPFRYSSKDRKAVTMSYWELPAEILDDRELLAGWVEEAVGVSHRAKARAPKK